MSQKFKFNIITGQNAGEKYAAIANKEPFTFYLLQTGVGYLGTVKLFDASTIKDSDESITGKFFRSVKPYVITQDDLEDAKVTVPEGTAVGDSGIMFVSDYNDTDDGDEELFFVPIKADVDVTGKYFRGVESHTITQTDLDDDNISKPTGTIIGDSGLLFTSDNNETDDGDEKKYFVPIKIEKPDVTESIEDSTLGTKIPTVAAVINYVTQVMEDKVAFEIDGEPGTETADGGMSFPGLYSEDEVRIGTWINGKPLYRKVFHGMSASSYTTSTIAVLIDLYIDSAIKLYGFLTTSDGTTIFPNTVGTSADSHSWLDIAENSIRFKSSRSTSWNRPVTAILEYTKTTD